MALDAAAFAVSRPRTLARGLTARVALTGIVAGSFLVRAVASAAHPAPRYFPDEYLYAAIARSIGSGDGLSVRGEAAHFPALLAPLLAAPFHALFEPVAAYRLTQIENALFMSLAAVPVYLLARRLSLSTRYALGCAAFTVLLPDFVYASYTLADPIAFPFALGAIYAGVVALDEPTWRRQAAFLALAGLATFARVQYVVLPLAFLVASVIVDRRRAVRSQRLTFALCGLPVLGVLALGPSRLLGYYSSVADLHVGAQLARWAATDVFLLALAAGVVLVPGALVALARPQGRTERSFAALVVVFAAGLLFEAALYASNGSARFQERYLFSLLPLVPVAFGLYLKHGRARRAGLGGIAAAIFLASVWQPLSQYSAANGRTDSPLLFAEYRLETVVGTGNGALVAALLVALACVAAVVLARSGAALAATLALVAVVSLGATLHDARTAGEVRDAMLAAGPSWVDATGLRDVTVVQTEGAAPAETVQQLYWNRSVTHEALLGDAVPTDVYAAPHVQVDADGTLAGVGDNVLFQGYGVTPRFANARLVAQAGSFGLWASDGPPRLTLLEEGRYHDGWLARAGMLRVWPDAAGATRGVLRFTLTLPTGAEPVRIAFGKARYDVRPGRLTRIAMTLDAKGPWSLRFDAAGGTLLPGNRAVSVQSSTPTFSRSGAPRPAPRSLA